MATNDRFYDQAFIFSDGSIVHQYVWESDVINNNKDKFPKNEKNEIGEPFFKESNEPSFMVLRKMNINQIQQDRLKRSREHFKKEIWETIPKSERKLFRDRNDIKK